MLAFIVQTAPIIIIIGVGMAVAGSIVGILWYRVFAPSSFDRGSVLFIIKLFSAIGAGTILLGVLMKRYNIS